MRVNETQVAAVVLKILARHPSGEAPIVSIVKEIPHYLELSDEDRIQSQWRPNEAIWEQQVRNITSHQGSPGNFVYEGYLEVIPGGLKVTEAGRLRATHKTG